MINPSIDLGRAKGTMLRDARALALLSEMNHEMMQKYSGFYQVENYPLEDLEKLPNCRAGSERVAVNWDREIKLCPIQTQGWISVGNIYSIKEEKTQKIMKAFYSMLAPSLKICGECTNLIYCMRCFIRPLNLLQKKDIFSDKCKWYLLNQSALEEAGFEVAGRN